jgi:hypothetical protein
MSVITPELVNNQPINYAAEIFNAAGDPTKLPESTTTNYIIQYEFDKQVDDDFHMNFTLSGGATWGIPSGTETWHSPSGLLADALQCDVSGLGITITENGTAGTSNAKFFVQASQVSVPDGAKCSLQFKITNASVLANSGGEVALKVELPKTLSIPGQGTQYADSDAEAILAKSGDGATIEFLNAQPAAGLPKVDVNLQSLGFIDGDEIEKPNTAVLGTIQLKSTGAVASDGSTPWKYGGTIDPQPSKAILSITNGNFSASLADPGKVFLDFSTTGSNKRVFDTAETIKDIAPSEITESTAKWELTSEQAKLLGAEANPDNAGKTEIVIVADTTNAINTFPEEPSVSLVINYPSRTYSQSGVLRHIKSNGTVCTLYNIPNTAAVDTLSVKITNNSNKTANLYGTLVAKDGSVLFKNKPLDPATIEPNATVRIDAAGLKTAGELTDDWAGRAVLTVTSDITDNNMSVSGLVRNSNGGPLMNMSVGATGNGCQ